MKLVLRDRTLRVGFVHEAIDVVKAPALAKYSHITTCYILFGSDKDTPPVAGSTLCHRSDQFNRAIGRKIAFRKAIAKFSRERRTELWAAMFEARTHAKCPPWTV